MYIVRSEIYYVLRMAEESKQLQEFTERACRVFRECSLVPSAAGAWIRPSDRSRYEVEVRWSQRELERGKKMAFCKSYFVERASQEEGAGLERVCTTAFQSDVTRIQKLAYSSDGSVKAVLVKEKPAKAEPAEEPQQYIEIWHSDALLKTINVQLLKKHGKIHDDIHFGSFHLSANGKQLLYIAEREKPKAVSYFKKLPEKPEEGPTPKRGEEYVYDPSWGEQLDSVVNPVPVVLDWETEECCVIDTEKMGDISAGQARWVPGEEGGVVFVGWENRPQKLGFVYCLNRRSALYHANHKTGDWKRLTENTHDVFSPRFSPQGDKLVYFEAVAEGPHHSCAALKMINWSSKAITTVVDIVKRPKPGQFPGFYAVFLPERCWDSRGQRVVLNDQWGSLQEVLSVSVEGGGVHRVTGEGMKGAWSVLDVSHDLVVAQFATPSMAPKLMTGALPVNPADPIAWTELAAASTGITEGLIWEVLTFNPPEKDAIPYEAILLKPKPDSSLPPLAVLPHGGPHVAISADFMVWPVCMAALGFAVLMVNYRGSSGFGQDCIFSLPGRVGTQDVNDVQNAARSVVERGVADGKKAVVLGGSHGGFLAVHLIGQFPDFYRAANVRNPVIDLAGMRCPSDIPDWDFVEVGLPYDPATVPTAEDFAKFIAASPISHAHKIKTPIQIHLGSADLRVPPSQGKYLYHTLKAMGKETRLLLYPGDSHPISSVYSDSDSFVNSMKWLYKHSCC